MDKRLRRCLSYDNRRLVEIDQVAAQPTLLGHLANDKVLIGDCIANNFYERLMEVLNRERPKDKWLIRDDVKEFFCAWNFGPNRLPNRPIRPGNCTLEALEIQKAVQKCYERMATYVWEQKQYGHSLFAQKLQRMESGLFVDGVLVELARQRIVGLTIHDSILASEDDVDQVVSIIEQQMAAQNIRGLLKIDGVVAMPSQPVLLPDLSFARETLAGRLPLTPNAGF